jgi:hypothetical protein
VSKGETHLQGKRKERRGAKKLPERDRDELLSSKLNLVSTLHVLFHFVDEQNDNEEHAGGSAGVWKKEGKLKTKQEREKLRHSPASTTERRARS